jgi:disulfide bond formation protein DsbB
MISLQSLPRSQAESMHRIFIFVLAIAAFVLCLSYSVEYFFHSKACLLCHIQRVAYLLLIPVSLLGLCTRCKMTAVRILQTILVLGCLAACYHSAVVFGIVNDPCLINPQIKDIASYKAVLEASPPCSASAWKLFHIPISFFNAALSISLTIAIQVATKRNNPKPAFQLSRLPLFQKDG